MLFFLGANLIIVVLIDLISYIIMLFLNMIVFYKKIPGDYGRHSFQREEKKRIIRYGLLCNFNDMGTQFLDTNIDNFILALYLDPVAVGIYSFCDRLGKMISRFSPISYLSEIVRPLYFSIGISAKKEELRQVNRIIIRYIFLYHITLLSYLIVVGKEIISLVIGKYSEYHFIFICIFLFISINAIEFSLGLAAQLEEKVNILLISKIFGIYNLIADLIFIKLWGIMGIVVATGSAVLFKNLFILWFVKELFPIKQIMFFLLKIIGYWAGCSIIISKLVIHDPLEKIIIVSLFFIVFIFIFFFFISPVDNTEKRFLRIIGEQNRAFRSILLRAKLLRPLN